MDVFRTAETHGRDVETFEDVQHLQGGDALAIGRQFKDFVAPVVGGDRLDPFRAMAGQVLVAEETTVLLHIAGNRPGHLALVEDVPASPRDLLIGIRQGRIAEHVALAGGTAAGSEDLLESRIAREPGDAALPVIGDDLGHRESLPGVTDRRVENFGHGQPAVTFVQLEPTVDGPGDAHGQRSVARDRLESVVPEILQRQGLR